MRVRLTGLVAVSLTALFALVSVSEVIAQDKAPKAAKAQKKAEPEKSNIQGVVQNLGKDTSTITVRVGSATRMVVYDAKTKFLYGHSDNNKPGAVAQVKTGYYVSCAGTFDAKAQLMANECVYRETK